MLFNLSFYHIYVYYIRAVLGIYSYKGDRVRR